jgi:hypothetical protein
MLKAYSGFKNILPRPVEIIKPPKQFFKCIICKRQFEKITDLHNHNCIS